MNKAALYIRVSTEEQAREGISVNAQIETLTQYCNLYNITIYKIYKDLGLSGKSIKKRTALQHMLKDADNSCFDMVLVWKISRLSRSLKDLLMIIDRLEKHNISFISHSEKLDTATPVGRMTLQLLGSIAEFERNTIVENVKLGLNEFARLGGKASSVLGYDNINKQLVINQSEAKIVQIIFDLYTNKKFNMSSIARYLNNLGYKTKRGKKFRSDSISLILNNPVYIGLNRHKVNTQNEHTIKGCHEPIIPIDMWNKAHDNNTIVKKESADTLPSALLTGLVICPKCQKPLRIFYSKAKGKCYRYYKCYTPNLKNGSCSGFLINADAMEKHIDKLIFTLLSNKTVINDLILKLSNNINSNEITIKLKELELEINKQKQLINNYLELFENSKFENSYMLMQRINFIENKIKLLEQEKQCCTVKGTFSLSTDIDELINCTKKAYMTLNSEEKRQLVTAIISKIQVDTNKQVKEVSFRFPVSILPD